MTSFSATSSLLPKLKNLLRPRPSLVIQASRWVATPPLWAMMEMRPGRGQGSIWAKGRDRPISRLMSPRPLGPTRRMP